MAYISDCVLIMDNIYALCLYICLHLYMLSHPLKTLSTERLQICGESPAPLLIHILMDMKLITRAH